MFLLCLYLKRCSHNDILILLYSKIKVWDLQAALDPRAPASTLCLRTLVVCKPHLFGVIWDLLCMRGMLSCYSGVGEKLRMFSKAWTAA